MSRMECHISDLPPTPEDDWMSFSSMHEDYLDPDRHMWERECEVCGVDPADCECPECPSCGEQGNPVCYAEMGIFGGCTHEYAWPWRNRKCL